MFKFGIRMRSMFATAIRSLQMHKLRSFLTVLGLVFGVASVIVMLAVAEGASQEAQRQIASLGVHNVIVRSIKPTDSEGDRFRGRFILEYGLTYEDLRRIKDAVGNIEQIMPQREFTQEFRAGPNKLRGRIAGVQPAFFAGNGLELARGRLLQDADLRHFANVCVIGDETARELFRFQNPIGKTVYTAQGQFFRVVGVTKYKTPSGGVGSSLSAQDLNRDVYIPLTTDRSRHGDIIFSYQKGSYSRERLELSQITVRVNDLALVKSTADVIESLLIKNHSQRDFAITVPLDLLEQAEASQRIFNFVLGATAAISLLVGGIGIMNIMLASVSERTQEIGIRRALGAKQTDIVMQFLIETATLSLIGTVIGLAVGLWTPALVSWLSGMETKVTIWAPVVAAAVSLAVGIVFGLYPAQQAAKLDPIEALRRV